MPCPSFFLCFLIGLPDSALAFTQSILRTISKNAFKNPKLIMQLPCLYSPIVPIALRIKPDPHYGWKDAARWPGCPSLSLSLSLCSVCIPDLQPHLLTYVQALSSLIEFLQISKPILQVKEMSLTVVTQLLPGDRDLLLGAKIKPRQLELGLTFSVCSFSSHLLPILLPSLTSPPSIPGVSASAPLHR